MSRPELDLDPGGRLTADGDEPAPDDLLGREVDLGGGGLGTGMELHAAEARAGPGGAGEGVDGRKPADECGRLDAEAAVVAGRAPPEREIRVAIHVAIRLRACGAMMSTDTFAAGLPSGRSTRPATVIRPRGRGLGSIVVGDDRTAGQPGPRRRRVSYGVPPHRHRWREPVGAGGESGEGQQGRMNSSSLWTAWI